MRIRNDAVINDLRNVVKDLHVLVDQHLVQLDARTLNWPPSGGIKARDTLVRSRAIRERKGPRDVSSTRGRSER